MDVYYLFGIYVFAYSELNMYNLKKNTNTKKGNTNDKTKLQFKEAA